MVSSRAGRFPFPGPRLRKETGIGSDLSGQFRLKSPKPWEKLGAPRPPPPQAVDQAMADYHQDGPMVLVTGSTARASRPNAPPSNDRPPDPQNTRSLNIISPRRIQLSSYNRIKNSQGDSTAKARHS